jgi:hypothetical protein
MTYPTSFGTLVDQQQLQQAPIPVYPTSAALALDQNIFPPGSIAVTVSPFALFQAQYSSPVTGSTQSSGFVQSTPSPQLAGAPAAIYWVQIAGLQRVQQTFTLAQLQALGASPATFNCLPVLPTNAKLVAFDVIINTPLAGNTSDTITVQSSADAAGTIVASTNIFTTQTAPAIGMQGSNPYMTRSAQQIQATITAGSALSGLTAGALTFSALVAVSL